MMLRTGSIVLQPALRDVLFVVVSLSWPLAVEVQRDDQQRLDEHGGIIRLNDNDPAFADSNEVGVPDRHPAAVCQTDVERSERLSMQRLTNAF